MKKRDSALSCINQSSWQFSAAGIVHRPKARSSMYKNTSSRPLLGGRHCQLWVVALSLLVFCGAVRDIADGDAAQIQRRLSAPRNLPFLFQVLASMPDSRSVLTCESSPVATSEIVEQSVLGPANLCRYDLLIIGLERPSTWSSYCFC